MATKQPRPAARRGRGRAFKDPATHHTAQLGCKYPEATVARWKARAVAAGLPFAEWLRRQCDAPEPLLVRPSQPPPAAKGGSK